MDSKKPWMSKTLWTAVIMALAAQFPPAAALFAANPAAVTTGLAAVFAGLRLVSNGKVSFSE